MKRESGIRYIEKLIMKRKSIIKGAFILTVAGILTRLIGFGYRIWMSNLIGAEGMGLYQLIVPVYSLAWSISASGFSTTVSKLTAQENAKCEYGNMGRILKQSMLISTFIALILSAAVYFFSDFIGLTLLKDARTISSLRLLAAAFPFMAASSCIRGYFYGLQEQMVPAVSQVLEQVVRITAIYFLAGLFIPKGLEFACSLAVIGIALGEIIAFVYVLYSYRIFKVKNALTKAPSLKPAAAYMLIFAMALPLTANRVTGSLLATIENILMPQRLMMYGLSKGGAMAAFGQLTGMVMPLLMFPSSLLISIATALVPAVSEAKAVKNEPRIRYTVSKSMLFTSIIGIGASALFVTFPHELGKAIYNQDELGRLLYLMGFICPLLYYQVTLSGILNGLGEQVFIFRNSLISSCINILFIYFLIPVYGINAFIAGWFLSLLAVSFLDFNRVIKRTGLKIDLNRWVFKPVLSAAACALVVKLLKTGTYFGLHYGLIIDILIFSCSYMFFILLLGVISVKDISSTVKSLF